MQNNESFWKSIVDKHLALAVSGILLSSCLVSLTIRESLIFIYTYIIRVKKINVKYFP